MDIQYISKHIRKFISIPIVICMGMAMFLSMRLMSIAFLYIFVTMNCILLNCIYAAKSYIHSNYIPILLIHVTM